MQLTEATTLDRKSGEAEGSAVPRTSLGNVEYYAQTESVMVVLLLTPNRSFAYVPIVNQ